MLLTCHRSLCRSSVKPHTRAQSFPALSAQDCSHMDEHGIAAALLPLVTAFCRVSAAFLK